MQINLKISIIRRKKNILENQSHTARNIALYIDNEACNDGNESLN
jgi:hypothetical protein